MGAIVTFLDLEKGELYELNVWISCYVS